MHTSKGLAPVLWVFIAVVLIGGGYLVAQKSKSKMENAEPVAKQAVTMTGQNGAEPQAVVPADWKIYRNEQYEFELKYPSTYYVYDYKVKPQDSFSAATVIEVRDSSVSYPSAMGPNLVVFVNKTFGGFSGTEAFLDYMHKTYPALKDFKPTGEKRVNLGLSEGIEFMGSKVHSLLGYWDGLIFEVSVYPPDHPDFSQILSTFRFTK